jgi:LysM repeat protein
MESNKDFKNQQEDSFTVHPLSRAKPVAQPKAVSKVQPKAQPYTGKKSLSNTTSSDKLPDEVQAKMENSFSQDFSNVNIHKDSSSAQDINAKAYAQGTDIHFAPGEYNPSSKEGQELIGHELTHVVQQSSGRVQPTIQGKDLNINNDSLLEKEADDAGIKAAQGQKVNYTASSEINSNSKTIQNKIEGLIHDNGERDNAKGNYNTATGIYTVSPGDTLYSISLRFGVPINALSSRLTGGVLQAGKTLVIDTSLVKTADQVAKPIVALDGKWPDTTPWPAQLGTKLTYSVGYTGDIKHKAQLILEKKKQILDVWSANIQQKDVEVSDIILEMAMGAAFAGIGGVLFGSLCKYAETAFSATISYAVAGATGQLAGDIIGLIKTKMQDLSTIEASPEILSEGTKKIDNSAATNLVNYYTYGMHNMFIADARNAGKKADLMAGLTEYQLAVICKGYDDLFLNMSSNNSSILQVLTNQYMNLLDMVYIANEMSGSENAKKNIDQKKHEYLMENSKGAALDKVRDGSIAIQGNMGYWSNPAPVLHNAVYDKGTINKAGMGYLNGMAIKDLDFTVALEFEAHDTAGILGGSEMFDTFTFHYMRSNNGISYFDFPDYQKLWLAKYYLQTDKELSEEKINSTYKLGLKKLDTVIENLKLPNNFSSDKTYHSGVRLGGY